MNRHVTMLRQRSTTVAAIGANVVTGAAAKIEEIADGGSTMTVSATTGMTDADSGGGRVSPISGAAR